MTADPIGELIETATEAKNLLEAQKLHYIAEELKSAISAVKQMRRGTVRPKVYMDDDVAWCLASDVREVLDLLLGGK